MPWIVPALVASLANSAVLVLVYLYLAWIERNQALRLFTLGWALYTIRFAGMLGYVLSAKTSTFWLAVDEIAAIASSAVLVIAMLRLAGWRVPRRIWLLVGLGLIWVAAMSVVRPALWLSSLPVYFICGANFIYLGIIFFTTPRLPVSEARFTGIVFILLGLHKLDYPLLRPIEWFAPWGYMIGAVLGLLGALGIVLIYLQLAHRRTALSRRNYRSLVEASPFPILVHRDDVLVFANQGVANLLSAGSAEELLGRNMREYMSATEIELPEPCEAGMPGCDEREFAISLQHDANKQLTLHTIGLDIEFEDEPARLVFCQDVTEKRRLQQRLRQAERLQSLGTLAGGIAHDFNNILFAIQGYTEMARQETSKSSQAYAYLEEVLSASQRAADLIRQILSFARHKERKAQQLALGSVVKEALRLLRASLPSTITFDIQLEKKALDAMVNADPTGIHQVMMNLCTNASHAMPGGGILTVGMMLVNINEGQARAINGLEPGPHVLLRVSDTGTGMPPEVQQHIFEPFYTTKPQGEGTGLGLSVVHGIVADFGGQIAVNSAIGQGTEFSIYLPVAGARHAEHVKAKTTVLPRGYGRVVLVDDEPVLLKLLVQMVGRLGYEPVPCADGRTALEAVRADPDGFCAVVSDQTMPQMTGLELAQQLAKAAPRLPVILLTGYSVSLSSDSWENTSVQTILYKPLLQRDLALALKSLCPAPPIVRSQA